MAKQRPVRLYRIVFKTTSGPHQLEFNRVGATPCAAKNAAFISLEVELASRPDLPKTGWYMESRTDITNNLTV